VVQHVIEYASEVRCS